MSLQRFVPSARDSGQRLSGQALPEAQREQLLRDCFDPEHGRGYTPGRVHVTCVVEDATA